MKLVSVTPDETVAQVLEKYPETLYTWIALRTNCAGCYLMRFCSLEYVAQCYSLDSSILLDELAEAISLFNQDT